MIILDITSANHVARRHAKIDIDRENGLCN